MLTFKQAVAVAEELLRSKVHPTAPNAVLVMGSAIDEAERWVFPYQDSRVLQGNSSAMLAGNLPIVVSKSDGTASFMDWHEAHTG